MKVENGMIEGDLQVIDRLRFEGLVTGAIIVGDGGSLDLRGTCQGDLIVTDGGIAVVSGLVQGSLILEGGTVELRGMVSGHVYRRAGNFQMSPSASVQGSVF